MNLIKRVANSIFGTIGGSALPIAPRMDFIPDGEGGVINFMDGNVNPIWLGLDIPSQQFWAYNFCSPLSAVIDRLAEAGANGILEIIDSEGNTVRTPKRDEKLKRIIRLMERPNANQTWKEFDAQQVVIAKIFGYCPVLAIRPAGFDTSYTQSLWNINPLDCRVVRNYEHSPYLNSNPIQYWNIRIFNRSYNIEPSDIILMKDGFIDVNNGEVPISKVAGLDFAVSNICAAMEADNVLLKKKGPLGVFSHDPKPDMAGWLPLTNEQKDELQKDLTQYGLTLGQKQYVVSKTPLKWNPMSFKVSELMTKETVRQGIDMICDRFAYPAELMSGKNATYENRRSAEKFCYQSNVIPFSLRKMDSYNFYFGLTDKLLTLDFDHLPILQDDALQSSQAYKALAEGIDVSWRSGMITWNEARRLQNMDTQSGMDIYFHEWKEKNGIVDMETQVTKIKNIE